MENFGIDLSPLIDFYKKDIEYINGKSEFEIFSNFYQHTDGNIILQWINNLFNTTSIKSSEKSLTFREIGNNYFKDKNYDKALRFYTKSISLAPYESDEFCLALGNRSAVLFAIQKFENCIDDILVCLTLNYSEILKYKLYIRLASCYLKLNLFDKSEDILEKLKDYLKNDEFDLQDKKDSLHDDITKIEKDILENKNINENKDIHEILKLPEFKNGDNEKFVFASNLISIEYNNMKGRHVVASKNIKLGEILFIEKPFAFVPISKEESSDLDEIADLKHFCYHCFKTTYSPMPCKNCFENYCSITCRNISWDKYHRFECTGSCIQIWSKIGVNFLACRMLILGANSGFENVYDKVQNNVEIFQNKYNNYERVFSLLSNIDKMEKSDILPHLVSSLAIVLYLREKTDFFSYLKQNFDNFKSIDDEILLNIVGSTLIKHILQVICNASTIESVQDDFYDKFNSVKQINDNNIFVNAVGIYPSVSMMNHSCDTNITNYFQNEYIIVKANRNIAKGEEIYNSYGYDCRKHITEERKVNLRKQYCFECVCSACTYPTKPEIFHEGLLCQECQGCSLSTSENYYKCTECTHEFNATNHFSYIRKAEKYYEKYESTKNVEFLKKCLSFREKVFYKYNYSLYTANLDLQTYFGNNGDFELWWYHTENSLEMDKHILGENSLRYAMNLRLSLIILLRYLSNFSIDNIEEEKMTEIKMLKYASSANEMLENCKTVFKLFYPEEKLKFDVINNLLENVSAVTTVLLNKCLFKEQQGDNLEEKFNDFLNT